MDIFTYPVADYHRQVNILQDYVDYSAIYASKVAGVDLETCKRIIREDIKPNGRFPIKDPKVHILQRHKNGDRRQKETTFAEYIHHVTKNELVMAPTMTAYLNPNQRKSFNAEYIVGNMNKRKVYKGKALACKLRGDKAGYGYFNIVQNGCKVKNNSVSGAHSSPSTPLFNKSSHSTLTSCCRISTSYANAGNEWFLQGNRHYNHPQVVFADLISVTKHHDLVATAQVFSVNNIYIPTVEDVMEVIHYSSKKYWDSGEIDIALHAYVTVMTPIERAVFVYKGDAYHLAKYNPDYMREMLTKLSTVATIPLTGPEYEPVLKDGDIRTLAFLLCSSIMQGRNLDEVKEASIEEYGIVVATAYNVKTTIESYRDFIQTTWRTPVLPPAISNLPQIIRKCVVTSDTDSSIFTNQYWTRWYTDGELFSPKTFHIGYVMTYLASQMVRHKLALMSANIGIIQEHRNLISMKNEYYYPVYSLTSVAKHYYGYKSAQEGNVLAELDPEIKGVHLRDSSAPPEVTERLAAFMYLILDRIMDSKKLSINEVLDYVSETEYAIRDDVAIGGHRYMKSLQIKDSAGYKQGEDNSNFKQYVFWNEVFGPSYGEAPPPPYESVKAIVEMNNATKFKRWANSLEDKALGARLLAWGERNGKYEKNIVAIPLSVCARVGVPKEISDNIAMRKMIKSIISPFYTVLESLGLYYLDANFTRMLSDHYVPTSRRITQVAA